MNVGLLTTLVLTNLDELDSNNSRITNEQILQQFNVGYALTCEIVPCLSRLALIPLMGGQQIYSLPPDNTNVIGVQVSTSGGSNQELSLARSLGVFRSLHLDYLTATGPQPSAVYLAGGQNIGVYPIPTAGAALGFANLYAQINCRPTAPVACTTAIFPVISTWTRTISVTNGAHFALGQQVTISDGYGSGVFLVTATTPLSLTLTRQSAAMPTTTPTSTGVAYSATSLAVASTAGFAIGQPVALTDGTNTLNFTIAGVNATTNVLTVTPLSSSSAPTIAVPTSLTVTSLLANAAVSMLDSYPFLVNTTDEPGFASCHDLLADYAVSTLATGYLSDVEGAQVRAAKAQSDFQAKLKLLAASVGVKG